jgi:cell division protein FtsN
MNRLFFGAYTDYDVYSAALDKLRQSAKGAFGVEKDGKYFLYAGSFSSKERVQKEQRDLSAKGVTLQVQQVVLPLSSVRITAGQFTSKSEADKAAARIKGEGLTVKVVLKGR